MNRYNGPCFGAQIHLFNQRRFSDVSANMRRALETEVQAEERRDLIATDEAAYIAYLERKYSLKPVRFDWGRSDVTNREACDVNYVSDQPTFTKRHVVTFHVPYSGSVMLLDCGPSTLHPTLPNVLIEEGAVAFDVDDRTGAPQFVDGEFERIKGLAETDEAALRNEVEQHSKLIRRLAEEVTRARRAEILRQEELVASLNVPVRRATSEAIVSLVPVQSRAVIIRLFRLSCGLAA